jgi:hypothetical protein
MQELEALHGRAAEKYFQHLLVEARGRDLLQKVGALRDGHPGLFSEPEPELGRETHRPKHPHGIFAVPMHRIADDAQDAGFQIRQPAGDVQHREVADIVVETVDREVPAPDIVFDGRAVDVVAHDAPVDADPVILAGVRAGILDGAPKGGDLDNLRAEAHVSEPESPANEPRASKQALDLLGLGVGHDVEVLGFAAKQQIPDAAAHEVGFEARLLQCVENLEGAATDVGPRDRVIGSGDSAGLGNCV